jgi:hypothetical protein
MNEQFRVVVTDLRIPFFRLMLFFVKAGLAAIPAAIIVTVIVTLVAAAIAAAMGASPVLMLRRWAL